MLTAEHNRISNLGKHHSEDTKAKISNSLTGKPHPHTEEQDRKISESLTGKKKSPEHIEHMRIAQQSIPHPPNKGTWQKGCIP